jgi:hypothetical protein
MLASEGLGRFGGLISLFFFGALFFGGANINKTPLSSYGLLMVSLKRSAHGEHGGGGTQQYPFPFHK